MFKSICYHQLQIDHKCSFIHLFLYHKFILIYCVQSTNISETGSSNYVRFTIRAQYLIHDLAQSSIQYTVAK